MTLNSQLALFFFQFIGTQYGLESPPIQYGVSAEVSEASELVSFIGQATERGLVPKQAPETVRITKEMRIFIGQNELKLRPMSKAVLLLFLLHPEGIPLKSIGDYSEELKRHYSKVTRSDNPDLIGRRVEKVLDVFSNELNINLSRVNAALSAMECSGDYCVSGTRGKPKSIPLSRSLVIWE